MIPEWAKVGAKVVCIDVGDHPEWRTNVSGRVWTGTISDEIAVGNIYTIRKCGVCPAWRQPSLWLNEVMRPLGLIICVEPGFNILRFRPLISRTQQQDADMFRELLGSLDPIIRADMLLDELGEA